MRTVVLITFNIYFFHNIGFNEHFPQSPQITNYVIYFANQDRLFGKEAHLCGPETLCRFATYLKHMSDLRAGKDQIRQGQGRYKRMFLILI